MVFRGTKGRLRSEAGPAGGIFVLRQFFPPSFFSVFKTYCLGLALPSRLSLLAAPVAPSCGAFGEGGALHEEAGPSAQIFSGHLSVNYCPIVLMSG